MMSRLSNQYNRILKYCKEFGGITAWEAAKELGIMQLGTRIFELKEMGFKIADVWIDDINRYGDKVRYKRYSIVGRKNIMSLINKWCRHG